MGKVERSTLVEKHGLGITLSRKTLTKGLVIDFMFLNLINLVYLIVGLTSLPGYYQRVTTQTIQTSGVGLVERSEW